MDPEEIENRQFLVTLRGYARDEVEAFREELAQEFRLLRKQLTKATSELSHTSAELERVTAELAQARSELAEERNRAASGPEAAPAEDKASIFKMIGQETERILLAAEHAAEQMHERAVKESAEMLADARARVQRSMEELEAARRAAEEDFAEITGVRSMVASQMEDIGRRLEETINRLRVPVELPGPKSARARQVQQSQATERLLAGGSALKQAESEAQKRRQRELEAARELAARQTAHLVQARQREEELQAVQSEAERRRAEAERQAREQETASVRREQEARAAAAAAEAERLKAAREADQRIQEEAERQAREQQEEQSRAAAQQAAQAEAERLARLEAEAAAVAEAERVAKAEAEKEAKEEAERVARLEAASEPDPKGGAKGAPATVAVNAQAQPSPESVAASPAEPAQTAAEKSSSLDALLEEIRRKREEGTATPPPEPAAEPAPGQDEIGKRNEALGDLPAQTARRLKRLLQEDHNDLLDRLRKQRGKGSVEDNLAPLEEQVQRFAAGLNEPLGRAFSEGRKAAGARSGGEPAGAVQRLISRQVVNPLRSEVSKAVSAGLEAEDSASGLSERVNGVFRVWKGVRTQLLGEGIAHSAYHQGLLDALGSIADARKTWVLADDEQDCPNDVCRRNADAGPVELRSAFPSGHLAPPAHGGCTCTLKGS